MIGIIHKDWDGDISLDKEDIENLYSGEIIQGEIADKKDLGELLLSFSEEDFKSAYPVKLNWDKNEPSKYHFEISPSGKDLLKEKNYLHTRYENGVNGSKISIYGPGKDDLIKENIEFALLKIWVDKDLD